MVGSARADVRSSVIVGVADEGVRLKSVKTAVVVVAIVPAPEERHLTAVPVRPRILPAVSGDDHAAECARARARNEGISREDQGLVHRCLRRSRKHGSRGYGLPVRLEPAAGIGIDQLDPTTVGIHVE